MSQLNYKPLFIPDIQLAIKIYLVKVYHVHLASSTIIEFKHFYLDANSTYGMIATTSAATRDGNAFNANVLE